MASAARGTRSGATAHWRSSPWRSGPPSHAWGSTAPHGWGRGHPAWRGGASRGWAHSQCQHSSGSDLLPVNLTSIHMLEGLLGLIGRLVLHIAVALGQVRVEPVHGHVNHLDLPVGGEDLLDVFLDDVSSETAQVDLSGPGAGTSAASVFVIFLHRLRFGTGASAVVVATAAGSGGPRGAGGTGGA